MTSVPLNTIHFMLAGVWAGGLLAFLIAVFAATAQPTKMTWLSVRTLVLLSAAELLLLVAVLVMGIMAAYPMVDPMYAAMFVTDSGRVLIAKFSMVLVVLTIGLLMHFVWLPALGRQAGTASSARLKLRIGVAVQVILALALGMAGGKLPHMHPPNHAVINDWPYSFRFSIENTLGMGMQDAIIRVWLGVALVILAGGAVLLGQRMGWQSKWRFGASIALAVGALGVGVPGLTIPAFPETYRPTPVAFKASSVAHAMQLFSENCVPCHGPQAKGDGVLAKTLPTKPVNLLMEPHANMHTPGDFFHWVTNGIPGTAMPAWGEKFSEEERWDIVNLVHAISRGYQARLVNPHVFPDPLYIAPPNFSYVAHDGSNSQLKYFREEKNVLLVMFSWPQSRERLDQLKASSADLKSRQTEVLLVPMNHLDQQELDAVTKDAPFPVVTEGAESIVRAYSLFRRTIRYPDIIGEGSVPAHMEFLLDRYGYLCARWIPALDTEGWADTQVLTQQIDRLNQDKNVLPLPGEFVHDTIGGAMDMSDMNHDMSKM
ncbi:MAG: c-type cytochrome [Nitrospira sp.]|nr:c-type cytochrome [Nitrospira sp.]